MPLGHLYRAVRDHIRDDRNTYKANDKGLLFRLADVFSRTWDLGFTAFGGPPVHFHIEHQRFVEGKGGKAAWVDEQTYQELFAICQGLPGPGSTKMLFCLALIHAGFLPAIFTFLIWSLPGAIGMYALSIGVENIGDRLPPIACAVLSGLNSATVGIIALAAVQLAEKAIKDKLTRILVLGSACAGLCYNALWYFPILMLVGGIATVIWDAWVRQQISRLQTRLRRRRDNQLAESEAATTDLGANESTKDSIPLEQQPPSMKAGVQRRTAATPSSSKSPETAATVRPDGSVPPPPSQAAPPSTDMQTYGIRVRVGLLIIAVFFATFIAILVTRGSITSPPRALDLFSNMYLAGTIIFGGGPVVIPLLREYVVQPGWVSSRDFLIGLAIIQAFPGPNFNFGVYLGALAMRGTGVATVVGAVLGYVGIFVPGITLAVGVQSIWRVIRTKPPVISLLRGLNATAVGLVFTAVYRLWEIGYIKPEATQGGSLVQEPWWVVVAVVSYASSAWFKAPPFAAIVLGAVLGLCWYGAVGRFGVLAG